jgi:hypothetical protein
MPPVQSRAPEGLDIVGKADNVTSYCLRCAPTRLASEHFDLHRFEAKWDRARCDSCDARLDSEARRV